ELWKRYHRYLSHIRALGLTLDVSRMRFDDAFVERMRPALASALSAMEGLEEGAIANPDENRMDGHYWLRAPDAPPPPGIATEIRKTIADVKKFAADVHSGTIRPPKGERYAGVLCIGIGG